MNNLNYAIFHGVAEHMYPSRCCHSFPAKNLVFEFFTILAMKVFVSDAKPPAAKGAPSNILFKNLWFVNPVLFYSAIQIYGS